MAVINTKVLLAVKLLLVILVALAIGYWSGLQEWTYYENLKALPFAEARDMAMRRWEKPSEPDPIWLTMLYATGIIVLVMLAYEGLSFMLEGLVSKLRQKNGV